MSDFEDARGPQAGHAAEAGDDGSAATIGAREAAERRQGQEEGNALPGAAHEVEDDLAADVDIDIGDAIEAAIDRLIADDEAGGEYDARLAEGGADRGLAEGGADRGEEGAGGRDDVIAELPAGPALVMTPAERFARGRDARTATPRSAHAGWRPAPDRPDPITLLEEQARTRVPELVPIRYGRMVASPFAFFRGAALVMAADLATTPVTGFQTQLCGDAHLLNFGLFASAERRLVFDINDFDETLPGPWEWDVKRLAASFEVAGRDRGFSKAERREAVLAAVRSYREAMLAAAQKGVLEVWYEHMSADELLALVLKEREAHRLPKEEAEAAVRVVRKARTRGHARAFSRLVHEVDSALRIRSNPPLIVPLSDMVGMTELDLATWMRTLVSAYRGSLAAHYHPIERYTYVDTALKVVGVGSVGARAWILLFVGRDNADPLFLQAKETQASVLERFLGRSRYAHSGERVVAGQRVMQATGDIFLGWVTVRGVDGHERDYYVRQLHDWKGGIRPETLRPDGARLYAKLCGITLARAHARWGERIKIASYLGRRDSFDRAIAEFAAGYADQNERDYEAFVAAVESGRLNARTGL